MVLYIQFADHVLPLEKKSLLEMQKKWENEINIFIYQDIYTLFRCFIKGSSVLGHLKSKKKTTVLVL